MNIETKYSVQNAKTLYRKEVNQLSTELKRLLRKINLLKTSIASYSVLSSEYRNAKKEIELARQQYDRTLVELNNAKSVNKKQKLNKNKHDLNYTQFDHKEVARRQKELLNGNNRPRFDMMSQYLEGRIASASLNYQISTMDTVV